MGTRTAKPQPTPHEDLRAFLDGHRATYPVHADFAAAIGCSDGRLSQILGGDRPRPKLAWEIERETGGRIKAARWFTAPAAARAVSC
jgi:hypothetical protein